jgi:hypothetical protein
MKKFTKRLTMIVAILLSLVLLTSSIVSTTLAKYVVTKSAEVKATLQTFGLTVTLESNTKEGNHILTKDTAKSKQTGDSVSIKFTDVILKPGDETYKNAIKASIGGDANVAANVIITVDIECNDEAFTLTSNDFTGFGTSKVYNPIEFYVGGSGINTAGDQYNTGNDVLATQSESDIANAIVTKLPAASTKIKDAEAAVNPDGGYVVTGNIDKGTKGVAAENLNLGFVWANAEGDDADEISTFISNHQGGASFTITYTITVQQA